MSSKQDEVECPVGMCMRRGGDRTEQRKLLPLKNWLRKVGSAEEGAVADAVMRGVMPARDG